MSFGACLVGRSTGCQASKDIELVGGHLEGAVGDTVRGQGRPRLRTARVLESWRHDANDLERVSAGDKRDLPADDSRVAGKVLLPRSVTQDEDWCGAASVVFHAECAT